MTIPPLQPKPKQPRGQKRVLDEQDREEERSTKRSHTSRTASSKKATQNPDPSLPAAPVTHVPPISPATPLPHNPYTHLLTPPSCSFSYLGYQPQPPNYQYYYNMNTTPQSQFMSIQHHPSNFPPQQHSSDIASSSRSPFPQINHQFRPYSPPK
jgi:hypothetical protein